MKTNNNQSNPRYSELTLGDKLSGLEIPVTVGLIVSGALASRDYFPGHHDKDAANELGSPHVFMNILTTNALVQRFVEQWAGPRARFIDLKIKLGMPNYPGDTLSFSGEVIALDDAKQQVTIGLQGKNAMGTHVSGSVSLLLPN